MKKGTLNNILVKTIAILVIILISIVSFCGIHKRDLNTWKNILPKFELSRELSNTRTFDFIVDKSTKSVEKEEDETDTTTGENQKDNVETTTTDGVEVINDASTKTAEEDKKIPINDPAILNKDNYKKSKSIVEKRLSDYKASDFSVRVDEKTGEISVATPYADNDESLIELITSPGKIEIIDTDSEEVLIDKSMISKTTAYYSQSSNSDESGETLYNLGLRISFTDAGQKKFKEIAKNHIETTDENGNSVKSTITVQIDGEDGRKYTTWFLPDENYTELPMTLYQNVSLDDMDVFNTYFNECLIQQIITNTDTMPIVYELNTGLYIESNLNNEFIRNIIIVAVTIFGIFVIINIFKNKVDGIIISLIEMCYIAIHLLLIRYAGVYLTLSGIITILLMAIANYILILALYNKEKTIEKLESFGRFVLTIIPLIIIVLVFTLLGKEINIQSVGMIGIWGILSFVCTLILSTVLFNTGNTKKNGVEKNEK